jgi:hypothetical protein
VVNPEKLDRDALLDHTHGYLLAAAKDKFSGQVLRIVGVALLHDLSMMSDGQLRTLYRELLS